MKTPKLNNVQTKKSTVNSSLGGKVRKSLGNPIGKKNVNISLKNAEHALNSIINDDPLEIKVKGNKNRMSLPANALRNISTKKSLKVNPTINNKKNQDGLQSESKSPKQKGKGKLKPLDISNSEVASETSPMSLKTKQKQKKQPNKSPAGKVGNKKSPVQENNTSPVKKNVDSRKAKIPFDLNLSENALTPLKNHATRSKTENGTAENKSPEVELGLKLEEALSPKSKRKLRKKLNKNKLQADGKVNVLKKDEKVSSEISGENEQSGKKKKKRRRRSLAKKSAEVSDPTLFTEINVMNGVNALLKVLNSNKPKQKDLFTEDQHVMLQVSLHKVSPQSKGVLHISLPHLILPEAPDVCLITPDLKGKRNEPDEAIDFYKEMLRKNEIDFISEIIPIRKLKKEYSQFEERAKLANRFDAILVDGRVNKMARIGRRFARSRKCVSAVKLDSKSLKSEFEKGLRKVALFSSGSGNTYSIKCGHAGMSAKEICDNIVSIGKVLASDHIIVGDKRNIESVYVRTASSKSFPVYISTISPNEAPVPKGKQQIVQKPVKGEVTTIEGADVVVYPSGVVKVKKRKNEAASDEEDNSLEKISNAKKSKMTTKSDLKPQNKVKGSKISKEASDDDDDDDDDDSSVESLTESMLDNLDGIDSEDIEIDEDEEVDDEEDEDTEDDSEEDDDKSEEEGDEEEEAESGADDSEGEDSDDYEAEIEAAEEEYLQEITKLSDGASKKNKGKRQKSNEKENIPTAAEKKKTRKAGPLPKGKAPQNQLKAAKGKSPTNQKKPEPQGKAKNATNLKKVPNLTVPPKGQSPISSPANQQKMKNKNNKNKPANLKPNSPKSPQGKSPQNAGVKRQPFKKKGKNAAKPKGKGKSP